MHPNSTPSRQQFVAVCGCGCGAPTLVAAQDSRGSGARKGEPLHYIRGHQHRGSLNARWRGGRSSTGGYATVHTWGGRKYEHRLVAERLIGRPLTTDEVIHHRDGDKRNNSPENLEIMSRAEHVRLHNPKRGWRKSA